MNAAIIPARGGSKGIPLKNLQVVNGTSLLSRTIKTALSSKLIDYVYVSSDSDEILNHAKLNGANIIKRNGNLSNDDASTDPVLLHGLSKIEQKIGPLDILVLLQCTSIFTSSEEIDFVIKGLNENLDKHDASFACSLNHSFLWSYNLKDNTSFGINHNSNLPRQRRQDISDLQYKELGSVYAIKRDSLIKTKSRFGSNPLPIEVQSLNKYLEIDSIEDLQVAEKIDCCEFVNKKIHPEIKNNLKNLKGLAMDFDGVFTDNLVLTNTKGHESIYCSKHDSLGISLLRKLNIKMIVITSEMNQSVVKRLEKLNLTYIRTKNDKSSELLKFMSSENIRKTEIAYVGNDLNDISIRPLVSTFLCPRDAIQEIKDISDFITNSSGGRGAIREVCDLILKFKNEIE